MKHVFTDISHIAHLWANQLQDSARNSGNFYFEGKTIFSYGSHFPIARHVTNERGENAVLFTERGYSVTTSKHISVVRQAASHLNLIYCCHPSVADHSNNFTFWVNEAEAFGQKLLKAKKPEIYLSEIAQIAQRVNKYAAFFDLTIPETLQAALSIGNKAEFLQYKDKKEEFEKQEKLRAQKELEKRHKKELAKWLKFETHRLYVHNGLDYLRLNVTDKRIETTQAVQIPLEIGKRFWQSLKSGKVQVGHKILDYTVNSINGTVKIGCHTFKTDYLLKFGESVFK